MISWHHSFDLHATSDRRQFTCGPDQIVTWSTSWYIRALWSALYLLVSPAFIRIILSRTILLQTHAPLFAVQQGSLHALTDLTSTRIAGWYLVHMKWIDLERYHLTRDHWSPEWQCINVIQKSSCTTTNNIPPWRLICVSSHVLNARRPNGIKWDLR